MVYALFRQYWKAIIIIDKSQLKSIAVMAQTIRIKKRRPVIKRRFIRQPEENLDPMGRLKKGRNLNRAEKQLLAVRWRKIGKSYYWIGQQLGVVPSTAYQYCKSALMQINEKLMEETKHLRVLELQRLDRMLEKLTNGLDAGDPQTVTAALKIMERRARYIGMLEQSPGQGQGNPDDVAKEIKLAADVLFKSVPYYNGDNADGDNGGE